MAAAFPVPACHAALTAVNTALPHIRPQPNAVCLHQLEATHTSETRHYSEDLCTDLLQLMHQAFCKT